MSHNIQFLSLHKSNSNSLKLHHLQVKSKFVSLDFNQPMIYDLYGCYSYLTFFVIKVSPHSGIISLFGNCIMKQCHRKFIFKQQNCLHNVQSLTTTFYYKELLFHTITQKKDCIESCNEIETIENWPQKMNANLFFNPFSYVRAADIMLQM